MDRGAYQATIRKFKVRRIEQLSTAQHTWITEEFEELSVTDKWKERKWGLSSFLYIGTLSWPITIRGPINSVFLNAQLSYV